MDRDAASIHLWETLFTDFRYAVRQLRQSPAFAAAVIFTLALAIGANTAIFSVVRTVLLQPLPYYDSSRLLCLWHGESQDYPWYTFSYPRFLYFQEHLRDAAELAAYDDEIVTVADSGEPMRVEGGSVSANFFSVLSIKPALGRGFLASEDRHGADPVVFLSDHFWQQHYRSDPAVLNRKLQIDGEEFTVIGVLPRGFQFQGTPVDVWRSRIVDTRTFAPSSVHLGASYLTVVARLREGISLAQAQSRLNVLSVQYRVDHRNNSDILGPVNAELLQRQLFANVDVILFVLWGSVVCLLIIACANAANLMLARAIARHRELSVRIALGASRWRIVRQLTAESILLCFGSVLVSLPISFCGMRLLVPALQDFSPSLPGVRFDAGILGFAFAVAALIGIGFGLIPLLLLGSKNVQAGLRSQERSFSASRWSVRWRNAAVAGQVALCLVLLGAAGLLTQSFVRMATTATGLRTAGILAFPLDLMPDRYQNAQARVNFYDAVLERVQTLPGVSAASIASRVNLVDSGLGFLVQVEGAPDLGSRNPSAQGRSISPDYFRVTGISLLRGRVFTNRDTAALSPVMIVNESFAKRFFPGQDPIGKHVTYSTDRINCEIVGVVRDVRASPQQIDADQEIYLPLAQRPWWVAKLLVQTDHPAGIAAVIRQRIQAVDQKQAVAEAYLLEQRIAERLGSPKTVMTVVGLFAVASFLLAGIGIYGVIVYTVAQRKKEIAVRIALGAGARQVRLLVFRQTLQLLLVGLAIGLPLSLVLNRLYRSLLFAVQPADPATLIAVVAVLLVMSLAVSYLPAVRASRIDPVLVLRAD